MRTIIIFFSLFIILVEISLVSCSRSERVINFDRNLKESIEPELVCKLLEDSILLDNIRDFSILSDTTFVVVDSRGAYLYHTSGFFKKQLANPGQTKGEIFSPSKIYATHNFVYIWCSSLMKIMIFNHEGNYIDEISDLKVGVKKIFVDSKDEVLYYYTNGAFNELKNKVVDVIYAYNIAEKSFKKIGERSGEDEVLSVWNNSGGIFVDTNKIYYLNPGNLIIYNLDLNSDKTVRYQIEDKSFKRGEIEDFRSTINNKTKLHDYIMHSSFARGLYKDNGQFIIVSEIGQFNEQNADPKDRKIKLYILDSLFSPKHTIIYDYINSPNIIIHSGSMYFLKFNLTDDDQEITLNRFSLLE